MMKADLTATRLFMWFKRMNVHVDLYVKRMYNNDVFFMKNISLRSKLQLKCRQEFYLRSES